MRLLSSSVMWHWLRVCALALALTPSAWGQSARQLPEDAPPKRQQKDNTPAESVVLRDPFLRTGLGLGVRLTWITDDDFDVVSDTDVLPSFFSRADLVLWQQDRLSLGAALTGSAAQTRSYVRGMPTELTTGNVLLGAFARYHLLSRVVGMARWSMGPRFLVSRFGPSGEPETLHFSSAEFSSELASGLAVQLAGSRNGQVHAPRLRAFFELGYELTATTALRYEVSDEGPLRTEPLELGLFGFRGPFLGVGVGGSF